MRGRRQRSNAGSYCREREARDGRDLAVLAHAGVRKIVRGIDVVAMQPRCAKIAEEAPGYLRIGAESHVIYFRKFRDEMRVEHVVRAERARKRLARGWKPGRR